MRGRTTAADHECRDLCLTALTDPLIVQCSPEQIRVGIVLAPEGPEEDLGLEEDLPESVLGHPGREMTVGAEEGAQAEDGEVRGHDGTDPPDDVHEKVDVDPGVGDATGDFAWLEEPGDGSKGVEFVEEESGADGEVVPWSEVLDRVPEEEEHDLEGRQAAVVQVRVEVEQEPAELGLAAGDFGVPPPAGTGGAVPGPLDRVVTEAGRGAGRTGQGCEAFRCGAARAATEKGLVGHQLGPSLPRRPEHVGAANVRAEELVPGPDPAQGEDAHGRPARAVEVLVVRTVWHARVVELAPDLQHHLARVKVVGVEV
ncbi:protein of unknown function [Taphrina deformans PYCC 5710]|uniref:Uncharacterized protein n=1 Tax=Taphrina deformans (strain PYCC 5710 / ATCC 11124 / CBS 356.35 / IMI 108563 / JCM 9778 / NBRC 8474) TaxID=1097556 RepID=R4X8F0_TAPDE|nr:protein of unknown function [Taphrina deformans PYCC 5710]|eukprot:CCG81863.1 protein of unknown function [Taphrina deformans PYCC 5710]